MQRNHSISQDNASMASTMKQSVKSDPPSTGVADVGLSSYNIALFHLVNHAFYKDLQSGDFPNRPAQSHHVSSAAPIQSIAFLRREHGIPREGRLKWMG